MNTQEKLEKARENLKQATQEGWLPKIQTKVWQTPDMVSKVRINKTNALPGEMLSPLVIVDVYAALQMRVKEVSKLRAFYHPDFTEMLFPEGESEIVKKINHFTHTLSKQEGKEHYFARQEIINDFLNKNVSFKELTERLVQCYAPYEYHWNELYNDVHNIIEDKNNKQNNRLK